MNMKGATASLSPVLRRVAPRSVLPCHLWIRAGRLVAVAYRHPLSDSSNGLAGPYTSVGGMASASRVEVACPGTQQRRASAPPAQKTGCEVMLPRLKYSALLIGCLFICGCGSDEPPKAQRCETCSGPGDCDSWLVCVQSTCVTSGCKPSGNNVFSSCKDCFSPPTGSSSGATGSCKVGGQFCTKNGDCCDFACLSDDNLCHDACTSNLQCKSLCCAVLKSGDRVCAASQFCP